MGSVSSSPRECWSAHFPTPKYPSVRVQIAPRIFQPRPRIPDQKKTIEEIRDGLKAGEVFYYADEFNVSWLPICERCGAKKDNR